MRLSSISIGKRLVVAFGTTGALTVFIAGVGVALLSVIQSNFSTIEEVDNRKIALSVALQTHASSLATAMRLQVHVDDADREAERTRSLALQASYDTDWAAIQAMPSEDEGEASARQRIEQQAAVFRSAVAHVQGLLAQGQRAPAQAALKAALLPAHAALNDTIGAFAARHAEDKASELTEASHAYGWAVGALVGLSLLCAGLSAIAAWLITASIVRPIRYVRDCALRMAEGNLTQKVERRQGFSGVDETSQMISAMQTMHNSLCEMVMAVSSNANSLATAAAQISAGNADLSHRTERQAISLQMAANTMEGLTANVLHHADGTVQAAELASGARGVAGRGGELMAQVVDTMNGIDGSSKKIADIIGLIDSIAFQTNILALNAAVEAARAGEQGRGFAVVATEVRALAQRSAGAAREIKTLISSSVDQVGEGAELVRQAGSTMAEIVAAIDRVSAITQDMSSATRDQRDSISQVGTTVSEIDQDTQHNAALVEQSAAAASSLSQQAQTLLQQVAKFQLPS